MFLKFNKISILLIACFSLLSGPALFAQTPQSSVEEVYVVTFPSNRKIAVPFTPDGKFASVTGKAHVDLDERGVATIKGEFANLPSVFDIGELFSTYIVWAVLPDGSTQNLGELKTDGADKLSNAKFDKEVSSGVFGMLVTAEPHYLVRQPSRAVVLRGAIPVGESGEAVKSAVVQCAFSENDYFRPIEELDKKKKKELRRTPLLVLGARNAVYLARNAGAENDAANEYNEAEVLLAQVNQLWGRKAKEKEIELLANQTIGKAANAERKALETREARRKAKDKEKTDAIIEEKESDLKQAERERDELREKLEKAEAELERVNNDFRDKYMQNGRLEKENLELKGEIKKSQEEYIRLKVENERLQTDVLRLQSATLFPQEIPILEKFLSVFGKVQRKDKGLMLTLPETIWEQADSEKFNSENSDKLQLLFQKIASMKYLEITIFSYSTAADEDLAAGQLFAENRAKVLAEQFMKNGVAATRIRTQAFLQNLPAKTAKKTAVVSSNRIEIVLKAIS